MTAPELTESEAADLLGEVTDAIAAGRGMGLGAWAILNRLRRLIAPPAVETRREWRVWLTRPEAELRAFQHDNQRDAEAGAAWLVGAALPGTTVEIEEREITTRVVSRRVVPRTTEGGEGNG